MKGKAIVWPKPLTVEVREVEVPKVKDNEVMLETAYSSVSQSSEANWLTSDEAHFVLGTTFPFTPGYAAAGIVREVGKDVKDYKPGDRVICRQPAGCHAQYVVTTENWLFHIAAPFSTVVLSSGHSNGMQEMHYGKIFTKCLDVKGSLVMADLDLQTKCDHIFLRMLERGQIKVPEYQDEIFQPEVAPELYQRVLKHDRNLKNPLFVWNANL